MNISIKQIRYFIAVANSGQISKAAAEFNVSQSAITTAIKGLERILGTPLFERHANGVSLRLEGSLFLNHANRICVALDEALHMPKRIQHDVSGQLSLAVTYTVAGYFIPPHLAKFCTMYPNIEVKLTEAVRNTIEDGLISGEFDLAMMLTSNLANQKDIDHEVLFRSRRRLWVNCHHEFLNEKNVSLREIAKQPLIMLTVDEAGESALRYWSRTFFQPNILFRTSSVEAVRSMVSNGTGVTILSDMVYRPWSLEGRQVKIVSIADAVPTMDIGLAWGNGFELKQTAKLFMEFMHLAIGRDNNV